jgi:hypothetical protein
MDSWHVLLQDGRAWGLARFDGGREMERRRALAARGHMITTEDALRLFPAAAKLWLYRVREVRRFTRAPRVRAARAGQLVVARVAIPQGTRVAKEDRAMMRYSFGVIPPQEIGKAVWTTATVNNLPDSAFAYIEGGGEKDEQGRTKPRSLRHFPIRGPDGKYDAAHVRNALARAPQSPLGAKAMPKIRAAARALGIGKPAGKE